MILLTGASGMVGQPIVQKLVGSGHRVRVLTSSAASAKKLKEQGVAETLVGNLRSDADVSQAMEGIETVVHIPPAVVEDEHEIGYRMVAAAEQVGIDHFVFISCYHPHPADVPSHHNKLLVEDALYKSELDFTILQPSMFMQNPQMLWPTVVETGVLAWPWSEHQRCALLDAVDLAEAVATVVADPRFRGGTYEISSDQTLSVAEMAVFLSEALGKPVRADHQNLEKFLAGMQAAGMPAWTVDNVRKMASFYNEFGYRGGNSVVYQAITGRKPTGYREFAARFVNEMKAISN